MSRIESLIEAMKAIHYKHDKAKKVRHYFAFSDGSKVMMYKTPPSQEKQLYLRGEIPDKIHESDLNTLHEMVSNNHRDKVKFRNSLFEKYGISQATHRISIMDGLIEKIGK